MSCNLIVMQLVAQALNHSPLLWFRGITKSLFSPQSLNIRCELNKVGIARVLPTLGKCAADCLVLQLLLVEIRQGGSLA